MHSLSQQGPFPGDDGRRDGSWLTESQGTDEAGICAAGLLVRPRHRLPCYYLPLRSEVSEWELPRPADTWRQTHRRKDHRVCRRSTSASSQQPNIRLAQPWARSQQNAIKSRDPQNIIMACKMRSAKEDVCCISCGNYRLHVWPGFIGFLAEAATPSAFTDFRDGTNNRKLHVTVVLHLLPLRQNVGLPHFQLKLKGAFTCIIYAPRAPSPALSGRVKGDFLMLWY